MWPLVCSTLNGLVFTHALLSSLLLPSVVTSTCPDYSNVETEVIKHLSPGSTVDNSTVHAERWSLYAAPNPRFVINVASESDVATIVCLKHHVLNDVY